MDHGLAAAETKPQSYVAMQSILDYKRLCGSPLFMGVDDQTLLNMLPVMQRERWPRGYCFNKPDQTGKRFYLLLKGRVKIGRLRPENGRELTLFLLGLGEGFNVLNLIDGGGHDLQITALDEIEVLSAPVERWLGWMEQYSMLRSAMANVAATYIERLSELAGELALDDTMTRLAHLLLRYFDSSSHGLGLIHDLPQEELANMIGTVRPVIARLLGELRRDGAIDTVNGKLHVSDFQRLLEKADRQQGSQRVARLRG